MFGNFMMGRYGIDHLTKAMLIAGILLTFFGDALEWSLFTLLSYVMFFGCVYRTTSKNITARQTENRKFLQYYNPAKSWMTNKISIAKSNKNYKYFKCPNCSQQLRVPKGRGKISVTCSKCNKKFLQKS